MINGVNAVTSPEACGYTTQLSFTELGFTSYSHWLRTETCSGYLANQEQHLSPFIKHRIIKRARIIKELRVHLRGTQGLQTGREG